MQTLNLILDLSEVTKGMPGVVGRRVQAIVAARVRRSCVSAQSYAHIHKMSAEDSGQAFGEFEPWSLWLDLTIGLLTGSGGRIVTWENLETR